MTRDDRDEIGPIPGYEIVRELGRGGMGAVYLARQLSLNRSVALKALPRPPKAEAVAQAERFRREAEMMARVTHPNIVGIHDFGIADGRPYLVMEFVEGGDLRRQVVPGRPMDPARARDLIGPVARAISFLHRNGILHRDLKPGNILMGEGKTPKVADFGIAMLDGAGPARSGPVAGTPDYVAPEQRYGLKVDERCDQFSLAAVAYELLTGRKALGPFAPPSRHNPGLSRGVDEAVLRALHEDRDERFATVEEFAAALDRGLAASRSTVARRTPARAAVLAAAVLGLGGLALAFRPGKEDTPRIALSSVAPDIPAQPKGVPPPPPAAPPPQAPPQTFQNLVGMKMLLMLPGEFLMGSPGEDPDATRDERPRHPVRITQAFYLAECEVTNRQFRRFVDATGYTTEAEGSGLGGFVFDPKAKAIVRDPKWTWKNPGYPQPPADDEPVVQVTWGDAVAFCNWLTREEHRPYRLPTEAEWEYACRAGTNTRWSTGDDPARLGLAAWTVENAGFRLHPVGLKEPNPWGLRDMHGNAWEWCDDWFGPYEAAAAADPRGLARGDKRALRGGSWDFGSVARTRSASRIPDPPGRPHFTHGFRVALGSRGGP